MDGQIGIYCQFNIGWDKGKDQTFMFHDRVRRLEDKGYSEYRGELKVFGFDMDREFILT